MTINRLKDISKKTFWAILIFLILTRITMVFFLMQDIPHTGVQEGGFWFYHGGDEIGYFNLAKSISQFNLVQETFPLGFPLFLAPFVYFSGAEETKDVMKPVFLINSIIFFSFAILIIAFTARRLFRSHKIASLCAAIFTFYPYLFYVLFRRMGPYFPQLGLTRGETTFQLLNWLQIISDALSAVLVYSSFFLFLVIIDEKKTSNIKLFFLGALAGYSAMVRVPNLFIVGVIVLGLLLKKGLKEAAKTGLVAFLFFLPQLIYNQIYHGFFLRFGQQALPTDYQNLFSLSSLDPGRWFGILQHTLFYSPIIAYAFPIVLVFMLLGIRYFWEKDRITAILLVLWFFSYFSFYSLFSLGGIMFRYFIPVIPPFIFINLGSFAWIYQKLKSKTAP